MPSKDWTGRQDLSDKPNKKNLGPRSKYEPAAAAAPEARPWQIRQLTKEQAPKEQKEQAQTDPAATNNNKGKTQGGLVISAKSKNPKEQRTSTIED